MFPETERKTGLSAFFLRGISGWVSLFALSAFGAWLCFAIHLGAGLLLGPMGASIFLAIRGFEGKIPRPLFLYAQAMLGVVVVSQISPTILISLLDHEWLMLFSILSVVVVSFAMGGWLAYKNIMPGSTALWGASPGGASTMVSICEEFGADPRLAAFMLYFRVVLVAVATSLVAWLALPNHAPGSRPDFLHQMISMGPGSIWITLGLVLICGTLAARLPIPATALLSSLAIGLFLKFMGWGDPAVPYWLRAPAYMIIGGAIGLRFTRPVLSHVIRALPAVAVSSTLVVVACALLAFPVAHFAHISLLSAYLATSPGGLDTIIIIADGEPVALPFIIAMQTGRMIAVLFLGPLIARPLGAWLAKRNRNQDSATEAQLDAKSSEGPEPPPPV